MVIKTKLICTKGPLRGYEFPINKAVFRIGANKDNDLIIADDKYVSRNHAHIRVEGDNFSLLDQNSRNGTTINGMRLDETPITLKAGDQIKIGDSLFVVAVPPDQIPSSQSYDHHREVGSSHNKSPMENQRVGTPADLLELPRLGKGQRLDLELIRDPGEKIYLPFIWLPTIAIVLALIYLIVYDFNTFLLTLGISLIFVLLQWVSWKLFSANIMGNCIKVGPRQYPQINSLITDASSILNIPKPDVFIMQGEGLFEIFVAKYFSHRGFLIFTSNLLDDLTEHGTSRELMFFVGRQLGLIATGYFKFWFFKHFLGQFSIFFYWAWQRRCHLTADRLGLLVTGDLYAAEQALCIITAGSGVAANTNIEAIQQQRLEAMDSVWGWLSLAFSSYPYMVDRIARLQKFASEASAKGLQANTPIAVAALPIRHHPIRALPLMIIHGHDMGARLELENFLLKQFPHVSLITMINETDGAYSLPEKFERIAGRIKGAVALLTPDDIAITVRDRSQNSRARQNVIIEIGWMWGKLGREHCLLLTRGDVEIPSDLSGVELHRFNGSPVECSEKLREFIAQLEIR